MKERLEQRVYQEPEEVVVWTREIRDRWSQAPGLDLEGSDFKHLAVICDGNRRAAKERGLKSYWGHRAGVETIGGVMDASKKWGIKNLTFWVWSTENWGRDSEQVEFVMGLASRFLGDNDFVNKFAENQARLVHLGRKDRLPSVVMQKITDLEKRTKGFGDLTVNLGMDYGGVDEVVRAVKRMVRQSAMGRFNLDDLRDDPDTILQFLDTGDQPKPDLVVRTGSKVDEVPHTSGFMPLQTTYAGWEFLDDLFPDLTPEILRDSIDKFINYERRMGK